MVFGKNKTQDKKYKVSTVGNYFKNNRWEYFLLLYALYSIMESEKVGQPSYK